MKKKDKQKVIWCIRAGKGGNAHDVFMNESVIALADAGLGDLTRLDDTRDAVYSVYRELHPDETRIGTAGIAGKFFRFIHEVKVGNLVLYPCVKDKMVYIGDIVGDYTFEKSDQNGYPHRRAIKWKYMIPKSDLSRQAGFELGAARTFFTISKNADEIMQKIANKSVQKYRKKAT